MYKKTNIPNTMEKKTLKKKKYDNGRPSSSRNFKLTAPVQVRALWTTQLITAHGGNTAHARYATDADVALFPNALESARAPCSLVHRIRSPVLNVIIRARI